MHTADLGCAAETQDGSEIRGPWLVPGGGEAPHTGSTLEMPTKYLLCAELGDRHGVGGSDAPEGPWPGVGLVEGLQE